MNNLPTIIILDPSITLPKISLILCDLLLTLWGLAQKVTDFYTNALKFNRRWKLSKVATIKSFQDKFFGNLYLRLRFVLFMKDSDALIITDNCGEIVVKTL
jgi:hypothetical protein